MILYQNIEQGSSDWHKLRAGCITGTKLKGIQGKITTATGFKSIYTAIFTLIGEEFFPPVPIFESEAMARGKILEGWAKEEFEKITGKKVTEMGFIKNSKYSDEYSKDTGGWLGLSPDGVIYEGDVITEAFEAKCFMPTNYVRTFLTNEIPDENYNQALTYFLVIPKLQRLYFTIANPDSYIEENKMKIIEITREELQKDLEETEEKLFEFRKMWIEQILLFLPK